jgi:hypothetical protein
MLSVPLFEIRQSTLVAAVLLMRSHALECLRTLPTQSRAGTRSNAFLSDLATARARLVRPPRGGVDLRFLRNHLKCPIQQRASHLMVWRVPTVLAKRECAAEERACRCSARMTGFQDDVHDDGDFDVLVRVWFAYARTSPITP